MERAPRQRVPLLAAISVGLALASSCFPLLATTVAGLGKWALAAIAANGALAWLVSRIYSELAGLYPTAAGVRTYVGQAFGEGRGLWLALLYVFLLVGLGASETFILSQVLHAIFPGLPPVAVSLGFVAGCALLNVLGIEPAGKAQMLLTFGLLAGLAVLAFCVLGAAPPVERASIAGLDPLLAGIAGSIFLFVGFEWVVSAVEEVDPQGRSLPRAMSLSILALFATYTLLALAYWKGLPADALGRGVTQHLALGATLGRTGFHCVAALSTVATVTCFNGGILGASRLTYALAREGVLPRRLATISSRFLTPWVAILAMSTLTAAGAALLATTSAVKVPILAGAAIECAVYAAVALAFARLRTARPGARPYRAPFGPGVARALALIFVVLAVACVVGAGEWALATAVSLGALVVLTGSLAWRAQRARRTRPKTRLLAEVTHG